MATSAIFNYAHTFFFDPASVGNASVAGISSINMFFQARPNFNNNQTGTQFPGISCYITPTVFGLPQVTANTFLNIARAEWNNIVTSSDGSVATTFRFPAPIQLATGLMYAFLISYDNNEQFVPWFDTKGYLLVGTQTPSPGPSTPMNGGQYFEFVNSGTLSQLEAATTQSQYLSFWNPLNNQWLKFNVNVARYYFNGVPVSNTLSSFPANSFVGTSTLSQTWDGNSTVTFSYPANRMECIQYNRSQSLQQAFIGAQRVWQNTVFSPGGNNNYGTVSSNMSNTLTANAQTSNGATFNWNTILGSYQGQMFLALFDVSGVNVRQVTSIVSNTVIAIDEPTTFVNAASKFMVTPVAYVSSLNNLGGMQKSSVMFLANSNANGSIRFTSCSIDPTTSLVTNAGTGYNNSDILTITGYESVIGKVPSVPTYSYGNYVATANLVTNASGAVTGISFNNVGAGFVQTSAVTIIVANSSSGNITGNTSNGTGAVFQINVGSTICTELANNVFRSCNVVNIPIHYADPFWSMSLPNEVNTEISMTMNYFANSDLSVNAGTVFYLNPTPQSLLLTMNQINRFNALNQPIPAFVSHSNEYIVFQTNGALNVVNALALSSNAYQLSMNIQSTNDYTAPSISTIPLVEFAQYLVNDDQTSENTNYGNAMAKHLTTMFTFTGNTQITTLAEDLRVYLTCYRPPAVDIEVYARIANAIDNENFNLEDWTRLVIVPGGGANSYSSPTLITDYVLLTYGFQGQPNSGITLTGTASTSNNSTTIAGQNTLFTTQLSNNSLIKLYDPLFPNNNFLVASVLSIASNVSMSIDQTLSTNSATGIGGFQLTAVNGLHIDTLPQPHQAFNNIWNSNVVRYYNASQHIYDGYNNLQIKILMLTADQHQIPRLNSISGIGLSA